MKSTLSRILGCTLLVVLLAVPAGAGTPCAGAHEAAQDAVASAELGLGLQQKLVTKIDNAWRLYSSGRKNGLKDAVHSLEVALRLLDSPATKQIPAAARGPVRSAIEAFLTCIQGGGEIQTATLTVRTFDVDFNALDNRGAPAAGGAIVRINGVEVGTTGADGTLTTEVAAGEVEIDAIVYPSTSGDATATLTAGQTASVDVVLYDSREPVEPTSLELAEAPDGVLDRTFTTATLRFVEANDALVSMKRIYLAELNPEGDSRMLDAAWFTTQANGTVAVTDMTSFRNALFATTGEIQLRLRGEDARGRLHDAVVTFFLARFRITGRLYAPPSNQALNVAGLTVVGKMLNTPLVIYATTDIGGRFSFPLLPSGNFEFKSESLQGERWYYGQGILVLDANYDLTVNMLHTDDLAAGIAEFTANPTTTTMAAFEGMSRSAPLYTDAPGRTDRVQEIPPLPRLVQLFVSAAFRNQLVSRTIDLDIPQGTTQVTLKYLVATAEYPYYVQAQSIYNDTWALRVRGGASGQQLFDIARQINSQLRRLQPLWRADGTTGEIEETLDVTALAANAPARLTLYASAMNVGDGILPTTVRASIENCTPGSTTNPCENVRIVRITRDRVPRNTEPSGVHTYYSIPRTGGTNLRERSFTLRIAKPAAATIQRVQADLLMEFGNSMQTVTNEGIGPRVRQVDANTLEVNISPNPSNIAGVPPPTHTISYRFTMVVNDNGVQRTAVKESDFSDSLWRMPDGFPRYSDRDTAVGGDDWASRGCYNWLNANRSLLPAINDVSGEHGRDIGHPRSHRRGTDIDIYHFYRMPGASAAQGMSNYLRLLARTREALTSGDATAKAEVRAFFVAIRSYSDILGAQPAVRNIIVPYGGASAFLPDAWATTLLHTGKISSPSMAYTLDLGLGNWSNSKVIPDPGHNDHIHISLNRMVLREE